MWLLTTLPWLLQALVLSNPTTETHTVWPGPPTNCKEPPCLTFDLHVQQTDFTSGHVTLLFQTGNHSAHTGLHLEGVSNITLSAEEGTVLVMSNSSTISCKNVANFKLKELTLVFDFDHTYSNEISAFEFQHCDLVLIQNCTFLGNYQTQARAIHSIEPVLTITSCHFQNNTAFKGGAISASGSHLQLSGNDFNGNRATHTIHCLGGAIYATHSTLVLRANNTFIRNRSNERGGAIYMAESNMTTSEDGYTEFTSNWARRKGGAIHSYKCYITLMSDSTFISNKVTKSDSGGGAMSITEGSLTITGSTITFTSNKAVRGGAVLLLVSTVKFEGSRITFNKNEADTGGGLVLQSTDLHTNNSQLVFSDNIGKIYTSAVWIGGSYRTTTREVVLTASLMKNRGQCTIEVWYTIETPVTFKHLHIQDSVGSAVCIYGSAVNFTGNTTISNCSTQQSGGGVYASNSDLRFVGTTLFSNNIADNGGGIYSMHGKLTLTGRSTQSTHSDVVFTRNRAKRSGGALYNYARHCSSCNREP